MRFALAFAPALLALLLPGCERAHEEPFPRETPSGEAPRPAANLPEASSFRFEQVEGTGFSREGWELEVLQVGGDIRVRGGVRAAGMLVPVFRSMDAGEFTDLWEWISAFPLDGFRVAEDTTAAPEGWRKTFRFDAVLGPEERRLSENEWTRPPTNAPWLQAIEDRLHLMVLELAGRELDQAGKAPAGVADSNGVVQKALEAIGDAPPPDPPPSPSLDD